MNQPENTSELAVLFADIGKSTSLYQQVGDTAAHKMITDCLTMMRQRVESAEGKLLRTVGDAVLASFEDCNSAFAAANAIQHALTNDKLSVRAGFHWGEVIPDQGDVYGNAVNIAARVSGLANVGEIVVTQEVVNRLTTYNKAKAQLLDRISLKGVSEPMQIYRMHWRDEETAQRTMYAPPPIADNKYVLTLKCGDQEVQLCDNEESVSIGRGENNTICIAHGAASRLHATVERKAGKYVLSDCSTNGTYVSKHGGPPVFIHRDSITLDGTGLLTLGFTPDNRPESKPGTITFVTKSKSTA